jgi:hypothetical protein
MTKAILSRDNPDKTLRIVRKKERNPIIGYRILHAELEEKYEQYMWDYDVLASVYEEYTVCSVDELESVLAEFLEDFTSLKVFPDIISEWAKKKQDTSTKDT